MGATSYPRTGVPTAEASAAANSTPTPTSAPSRRTMASTLTRVRNRTRFSGIRSHAVSSGQVSVSERTADRFSPPNQTISSTFTIQNDALAIINDPDGCTPSPGAAGYLVRGRVIGPDGNERDQQVECVPYAGSSFTDNSLEMTLSARAPEQDGSYVYRYQFEYANTGDVIGTIPVTVTVDSEAPADPGNEDLGSCGSLTDLLNNPDCTPSRLLLPSGSQVGAGLLGGGATLLVVVVLLLVLLIR